MSPFKNHYFKILIVVYVTKDTLK